MKIKSSDIRWNTPVPSGGTGPQGPAGPACPLTDLTDVTITADEEGDIFYTNSALEKVNLHHATNAGQLLQSGGHAANPSWGIKITVANSAPSTPATGDLWIDTN